jgi:hypothetical protein
VKRPLVFIFIVLTASLAAGQDSKTGANKKAKPDLSGTWQLDSYETSKGKSVKATDVVFMIVKYQEPEIKFIENNGRTDEQELIYYSDGRGEENPSGISVSSVSREPDPTQFSEKLASKTKWDGDKLVSRGLLRRVVSGQIFRLEIVKEWKLSSDGKTLNETTRKTFLNASGIELRGPGRTRSDMTNETKKLYRRCD